MGQRKRERMKSKIQKMLYLLALVNRYIGMTATNVTLYISMYVLYVVHSIFYKSALTPYTQLYKYCWVYSSNVEKLNMYYSMALTLLYNPNPLSLSLSHTHTYTILCTFSFPF